MAWQLASSTRAPILVQPPDPLAQAPSQQQQATVVCSLLCQFTGMIYPLRFGVQLVPGSVKILHSRQVRSGIFKRCSSPYMGGLLT